MTLSLRRLAQGGVTRQIQTRLQCDKDELTWAIRNGVYGGENTLSKQRYEKRRTSYQLTVRKFRHSPIGTGPCPMTPT